MLPLRQVTAAFTRLLTCNAEVADLQSFTENYAKIRDWNLPVPVLQLLKILLQHPTERDSGRLIKYADALLNRLEEDIDREDLRYCRFSMPRDDIKKAASTLSSIGEHKLGEKLLKLAADKAMVMEGQQKASRQRLPQICFPVVYKAAESQVVVWNHFVTAGDKRRFDTYPPVSARPADKFLADSPKGLAVRNFFKRAVGPNIETDFICPLHDLAGMSIDGNSWSLAAWAELWHRLQNVRLPAGKIALTGEINPEKYSFDGEIGGVGYVSLKVETALAAGFTHVIIPAKNFNELPSWLQKDSRIYAINSVYDLADWFKLHDPQYSTNERLFNFARGVSGDKKLNTEVCVKFFKSELRNDSMLMTFKRLKDLCRSSSRVGRLKRWSRILEILRTALLKMLSDQESRNAEPKVWFRILQLVLAEANWLLYTPFLLYQFRLQRPLVSALYERLGYRLADHDLNLMLALSWGKSCFKGVASPWNDVDFREQYPLLSWFLFSDILEAIEYLAKWPDLSEREKAWLAVILEGLARINMENLAEYGYSWQKLNRNLLLRAASNDFLDFVPDCASVTDFFQRPMKLASILRTATNLKPLWIEHLAKLKDVYIKVCDNADLEKNIERILRYDENFDISPASPRWLKKLDEKLSECLTGAEKNVDIARIILEDQAERNSIALQGFLDLSLSGDSRDVFDMQCNFNPALSLVMIAINYRFKSIGKDTAREYLNEWKSSLQICLSIDYGLRQLLVKESLFYFAGLLSQKDFLPDCTNLFCSSPGFWSGCYFAGSAPEHLDKCKESLLKSVNKMHFASLFWVSKFRSSPIKNDIISACKSKLKRCGNIQKKAILFALLSSVWSDQDWTDVGEEICDRKNKLVEEFFKFPDGPGENKSIRQAVLPFVFSADNRFSMGDINRVLCRLAGSRGFSPLSFCLAVADDFNSRHPLINRRWWQMDWEQNIYFSIYVMQSYIDGEYTRLKKLLLNDSIDIANSFLIQKLLESISDHSPDSSHE